MLKTRLSKRISSATSKIFSKRLVVLQSQGQGSTSKNSRNVTSNPSSTTTMRSVKQRKPFRLRRRKLSRQQRMKRKRLTCIASGMAASRRLATSVLSRLVSSVVVVNIQRPARSSLVSSQSKSPSISARKPQFQLHQRATDGRKSSMIKKARGSPCGRKMSMAITNMSCLQQTRMSRARATTRVRKKKARELKKHIDKIVQTTAKVSKSSLWLTRQKATAVYAAGPGDPAPRRRRRPRRRCGPAAPSRPAAPFDRDHALRRRRRPCGGSCCSRCGARRRPCRASRSRRSRRAAPGGSSSPAWSAASRCPPPARRPAAPPVRGRLSWMTLVGRRRLGRAQQVLDVAQRVLVLADTSNSASASSKPSLPASSSRLVAVRPSRCSSFSTSSRPLATVCCVLQRVEPGAHLGAGARALQEVQLGVEPVHRRAALAHGDDLHRLAVLQRRLQRHHRAVDARAAAAVADVGVQRVGEVDRRAARGQLDRRWPAA